MGPLARSRRPPGITYFFESTNKAAALATTFSLRLSSRRSLFRSSSDQHWAAGSSSHHSGTPRRSFGNVRLSLLISVSETWEPSSSRSSKFVQVAAEFLLPEGAFLRAWEKVKHADIREVVARLKADFCVSSTAVACRLWNLKQISDELWWELYKEYRAHWEAQKAKQKEGDGGPSYYIVKQHKLGKALVHLIGSAVDARELSMSRAGRILGNNPLGLAQMREAAGG